MRAEDTIFALSSGAPPSGIAVIRASGPGVRFGLETMLGFLPEPRQATFGSIWDRSGTAVDRGIVLYFPAPASFTGEDVAEFQVHGGRAVVAAMLRALADLPGYRMADAGEFTRRAFENGRADLTEVEGLADLVSAETEMQRRLAMAQAGGQLRRIGEDWRRRLIEARAYIEAALDFSDEADVPVAVAEAANAEIVTVIREMDEAVADAGFAERVRTGFDVVLLGAPNVGKSTLLNALAGREAAIVTAEAGTTRDIVEVAMDVDGYAVTLVDTAGLREADNLVEREGVRRARARGGSADLILSLSDGVQGEVAEVAELTGPKLRVRTKIDAASLSDSDSKRVDVVISATTGEGLAALREAIGKALGLQRARPAPMVARERQRREIEAARVALQAAIGEPAAELKAERLRQASDAIGRLTGRIDVDDWLDVIFREFCIGK